VTELLEKRIAEVSQAVANGVVVQSDAQFLLQMLTVQSEKIHDLDCSLEFVNDVIKERESWADMRLETCKKLEAENDKLKAQLSKCKEQRDSTIGAMCFEYGCGDILIHDKKIMEAEIEAIK
jgi:hypothetical protein